MVVDHRLSSVDVEIPEVRPEVSFSKISGTYYQLYEKAHKLRDDIVYCNRSKIPSHHVRKELIETLHGLIESAQALADQYKQKGELANEDKYKKASLAYQKDLILQKAIYERIEKDKEALTPPELILEAAESVRSKIQAVTDTSIN